MLIEEWEIWNTYSSSFDDTFENLVEIGQRIVERGFARTVALQDGHCFWSDEGVLVEGEVHLEFDRQSKSALIRIDSLDEPPYQVEKDLVRAGHLRYAEVLLYGEGGYLPHPYLRAFLPPFVLLSDDRTISFSPIVKLYSTGVILVELPFRDDGEAADSLSLKKFVSEHAALFMSRFSEVAAPPSFARSAPAGTRVKELNEMGVADRIRWLDLERDHKRWVTDSTAKVRRFEGDIQLAPILPSDRSGGRESLAGISRLIMGVLGYEASFPREAVGFALVGHPRLAAPTGLWVGRQHIHLLDFSDQRGLASLNDHFLRPELTAILGRDVVAGDYDFLPPDSVPHERFSAYLDRQSTLWVWSTKGRTLARRWMDSHRGHLIFENQVQCEMLDYGFAFQNRFIELAGRHGRTDEVIQAQRDSVMFQRDLSRATAYSMVQDLLEEGWERMGLQETRRIAESALGLAQSETSLALTTSLRMMGILVTVIFGFLAIPQFASNVVEPVLSLSPIGLPNETTERGLVLLGVSTSLVVGGLCVAWWLVAKRLQI